MPALGRAVACLGPGRQDILINNCHPLDVVGENPRRHQAGHSGPEHHRLLSRTTRRSD